MKKIVVIVIVILMAAVLGLCLWGVNFSVDAAGYEVEILNLPESFNGFKIAAISDVHGRRLNAIIRSAAEAEPDIIAVTGDLIDDPDELEGLDEFIARLVEIAPVYYVTGNHEWSSGTAEEVCDIIEAQGGRALRNEYVVLEHEDGSLVVAGADDPNGYADMKPHTELRAEIAENCPGAAVIMLYHRNYGYEGLGADVLLCGHDHGAYLSPFHGGLSWETHRSGAYLENGMVVIVSRGLGCSVLPFRLISRIHMPVVTLSGGN